MDGEPRRIWQESEGLRNRPALRGPRREASSDGDADLEDRFSPGGAACPPDAAPPDRPAAALVLVSALAAVGLGPAAVPAAAATV
ncbi:hypothetical protein, partial [Streptomyces sp. NPDC006324]|uniref:hypothetical protein n=1 Tax=Streptomyces sp. NPDC006324 TaxID=3156751 RepID=UPI0033B5407B